ncbi:hypothetical protein DJ568_01080 [Mucilaginibacter hurinus]|uniref:Uncharacterized protein n=1 Tax=Mucilaginibacter hurinus TaxID=2201324 RepID=A0A367GUL4_9SPHI|nr:hypothetical protein DJ568_01080 [Mucilaginibacter hurinus]
MLAIMQSRAIGTQSIYIKKLHRLKPWYNVLPIQPVKSNQTATLKNVWRLSNPFSFIIQYNAGIKNSADVTIFQGSGNK